MKWLAEYLHRKPIETSGPKCESPKRMQRRRIDALKDEKFKCKGKHLHLIQVSGKGVLDLFILLLITITILIEDDCIVKR